MDRALKEEPVLALTLGQLPSIIILIRVSIMNSILLTTLIVREDFLLEKLKLPQLLQPQPQLQTTTIMMGLDFPQIQQIALIAGSEIVLVLDSEQQQIMVSAQDLEIPFQALQIVLTIMDFHRMVLGIVSEHLSEEQEPP